MTNKFVFLGGTCGGNKWRPGFIAALVALGASADSLFDPVVENWNAAAKQAEEEAKAKATHKVFYLADSKLEGINVRIADLLEAAISLYDNPGSEGAVVFCTDGLSGHTLKSMNQAAAVLQKRFPDRKIFGTRAEATGPCGHLVTADTEPSSFSSYSMLEATMALFDAPATTVVVFDSEGMRGRSLEAMIYAEETLRDHFPDARILSSRQEAIDWLAGELAAAPV